MTNPTQDVAASMLVPGDMQRGDTAALCAALHPSNAPFPPCACVSCVCLIPVQVIEEQHTFLDRQAVLLRCSLEQLNDDDKVTGGRQRGVWIGSGVGGDRGVCGLGQGWGETEGGVDWVLGGKRQRGAGSWAEAGRGVGQGRAGSAGVKTTHRWC